MPAAPSIVTPLFVTPTPAAPLVVLAPGSGSAPAAPAEVQAGAAVPQGAGINVSGVDNGDWTTVDGFWASVAAVYGRPSYQREEASETFTASWAPGSNRWELYRNAALLFYAVGDVADVVDVATEDWIVVGSDLTTSPVITASQSGPTAPLAVQA